MLTRQNDLAILIEYLERLRNHAVRRPLRIVALVADRRRRVNRVSDKNWPDEAHAVVPVRHCAGINVARRHSHRDAQNQRAVGDSLSKRLRAAPCLVHVVRVKVPRLPCVQHHIRLRDGAPTGHPLVTELIILEIDLLNLHGLSLSTLAFDPAKGVSECPE